MENAMFFLILLNYDSMKIQLQNWHSKCNSEKKHAARNGQAN